ncbi:MAG: glycosyltransferase family 9 protein [Candidatus Omnitrophica bacterium]|nr:glycosyltransferase family 9 protein [Candidatus Omnitrophota bacterium]
MENEREKFKKILVVNLGGIGDILLSLPALKALRGLYPDARVEMLIVPRLHDLVRGLSYVDDAAVLHLGLRAKGGLFRIWRNTLALLRLRKRHFDLAVNMRTLVSGKSAFEMRLLFAIIGPKVKAGRDTEGRGSFFDVAVPESDAGDKYERDYDIAMVKRLGARDVDERIDYRVDEESRARVSRVLEGYGVSSGDVLIGINPGGTPAHRWPSERFARVIEKITGKTDARFVITGDAQEKGLAGKLKNDAGANVIDLAGRLSIKELFALIERCGLFITNDTGPMHIAAVLGTPLVAIFGPGYLARYDPRKVSDRAIVLYDKVGCAPCNKKRCASMTCLTGISVDSVVKSSLDILGDRK